MTGGRRRAVLAMVAAVSIGLAGCGIPSETDVRVDGSGPSPGLGTNTGAGADIDPPARDVATSEEEFVDNFLQAAAGDPAEAYQRIRAYLAPGSEPGAKEQSGEPALHLVRVLQRTVTDGRAGTQVNLKVQHVGVLDPDGEVRPATLNQSVYTFRIGTVEGKDGWFVVTMPAGADVLLLNVDSLDRYYEQQTLYFWNLDGTALVPDPRYMPRAVPRGGQPTEILDRLVAGPSDLLGEVVRPLPKGTKPTGTVPDNPDRLEISLSAEAAGGDYDPAGLASQIMWSLPAALRKELVLKIEGQQDQTFQPDESYLGANPAHELAETPERFAVYQGKVHRLNSSPNGGGDPLPPVLTDQVNHDVVSAAMAREVGVSAAALVVAQNGRQRLLVAAIRDDQPVKVIPTDTKPGSTIGRPVWLKAPLDTGLVVVGGALYWFARDRTGLRPVRGAPGGVRAVSAAPDGRRIAVVANGKLSVVALSRDAGVVEAQETRPVPTSLRELTDVAWSSEWSLLVAGQKGAEFMIVETSIDGAEERDLEYDVGGAAVTHLVAYPSNPLGSAGTNVMFAAGNLGYDAQGDQPLIEPGEVVGAPAGAQPGQATAPFFLY